MATRPIFLPLAAAPWVRRRNIEFQWFAGMASSQKQKSIDSLHAAVRASLGLQRILEISSKSKLSEGVRASAFNLRITLPDGHETTVECAYQGSKRTTSGGPYRDLYRATSLDAKRDERLRRADDRLVEFDYFGESWSLRPMTMFYDWLYLTALSQPHNDALRSAIARYEGFTDIEFNPEKSVSCQAASAALFVAQNLAGCLMESIASKGRFASIYGEVPAVEANGQGTLL